MSDLAKYRSDAQNDNENEFFDPKLLQGTAVRFFTRPIEKYSEFAEKKCFGCFSAPKPLTGHSLTGRSQSQIRKQHNEIEFFRMIF